MHLRKTFANIERYKCEYTNVVCIIKCANLRVDIYRNFDFACVFFYAYSMLLEINFSEKNIHSKAYYF